MKYYKSMKAWTGSFALIFMMIFFTMPSVFGQYGWVKHYPQPSTLETTFTYDVEQTQDGGYFIGGGTLTEACLFRLDSDGDVIWYKEYPSLGLGAVWAIAELPNGGAIFWWYTAGGQEQVVATTANGNIDWIQTYTGLGLTNPSPAVGALGIKRTSDDNYFLFNKEGSVFKISPTGVLLWTKETHDPVAPYLFYPSPYGHNIIELINDSYLLIGGEPDFSTNHQMTAIVIDSSGVLQRKRLAHRNMKGISVVQTTNQELIFCGNNDNQPKDSLILIKTDANLNPIWTKTHLLDSVNVDVWDIQIASNGYIWCLAARSPFQTPAGVHILIYDANGNFLEKKDLSADLLASVGIAYDTYSQSGLSLDNPNCKLLRTTDGGMVVGLTAATAAPWVSMMALIKMDTAGRFSPVIVGNVFNDINFDCLHSTGELPLQGLVVRATRVSDNQTFYGTTDTSGYYDVAVDTGTFTVELPTLFYWQACNPIPQVFLNGQVIDTVDFAMQSIISCPLLEVDISVPLLRQTVSSFYDVSVCNTGTAVSTNPQVEVEIDPFLNVISASLPIVSQNGNIYTFNLDTLGIGDCQLFNIEVIVDTSAQLGQTHCSEAHVSPDTICLPSYWNGPIIEIMGTCQNDSVFFDIQNTGAAMLSTKNYYVFEDHVMMRTGTFQLGAGASTTVKELAKPGKTYRLSGEQMAGFPKLLGDRLATAVIEGCVADTNGIFNVGFVNQFSNGSSSPFFAIDCEQNRASYDPNDKTSQPEGYQSQHYIDSTIAIDYKIRFQNTGTDSAFHIIVRDTLSPFLDPSTIKMGASSHDYTWKLMNDRVLKVIFPNIMLVDSNTNEPLSHGFFRYRIEQKSNNPIGTVIENTAAIYFDYNPPIFTNTTFHTIGHDFVQILLTTDKIFDAKTDVLVYPNPFSDFTTLEIKGTAYDDLTLRVYDLAGREMRIVQVNGASKIQLHKGNLQQGMYIYQLEGDGQLISTGKIIVQIP